MPKARKHLISLEATAYYHCVSRCVRRAFLCGFDSLTNKDFSHRRQWIEERILELGSAMSIEVLAYAVMSNHLHVVLRADAPLALSLSTDEVIERWHSLYSGTVVSRKYVQGFPLDEAETMQLEDTVATWRERLYDISWFMRALNEPIARQANIEDECTGKFWESRFKSQALVGDEAILSCMVYVDLNPVRAKMADTPEESDYTSIKRRIEAIRSPGNASVEGLAKFASKPGQAKPSSDTEKILESEGEHHHETRAIIPVTRFSDELPIPLDQYLELVDFTGRLIKENKRGFIPEVAPPILERLKIGRHQWRCIATTFESRFKTMAGTAAKLTNAAEAFGLKRRQGISAATLLYG